MTAQYWFMFPIAILISTIAMAVGVGGATFFAPIFLATVLLLAGTALAAPVSNYEITRSVIAGGGGLAENSPYALNATIGQAAVGTNVVGAVKLCENTAGPVARICKMALLKHDRPKPEMREAVEDAAIHEVPVLEKRLSILATIAHISPLLGLLGTVIGMIKAFHKIQELTMAGSPVDPGQLAEGIWEALITTAFGLLVAIPTFVAYNYLVSKVNNIVTDMERSATDLVNLLVEKDQGL